jgi:hypothetical protein
LSPNNFEWAAIEGQYHCAEQIEYTILRFYNYTLEAASRKIPFPSDFQAGDMSLLFPYA